MSELFKKLEMPVLTDLHAKWPEGVDVETSTPVLPDLYAGEPIVVTARASGLKGDVSIKGCIGSQPWKAVLSLGSPSHGSGVAKLWARDKIDNLVNDLFGDGNPEETRKQVIALALEHSLVTEFTSLVAVDSTPARPGEERLISQNVPVNLPRGWDHVNEFDRLGHASLKRSILSNIRPIAPRVLPQLAAQNSGSTTDASRSSVGLATGVASPLNSPPSPPSQQRQHHYKLFLQTGKNSGVSVETGGHSELWTDSSDIEATQSSADKLKDDELACRMSMGTENHPMPQKGH